MEDEYDRRQALAYNQTNAFVYLVEDMGNRFPNVKFAYSIKLEVSYSRATLALHCNSHIVNVHCFVLPTFPVRRRWRCVGVI